jgi:hypothetical protein
MERGTALRAVPRVTRAVYVAGRVYAHTASMSESSPTFAWLG